MKFCINRPQIIGFHPVMRGANGSDKNGVVSSMMLSSVTSLKSCCSMSILETMLRRRSSKRLECQFTNHTRATWTLCASQHYFSKMVKLNKYVEIMICRNRSDGSPIKELCDSYNQDRETILRILQQNLVLPVDKGLLPASKETKKKVLKMSNGLKSNPYLTLDQLNMRFPEVFNEFCMNRMRKNTREFLISLSKDN